MFRIEPLGRHHDRESFDCGNSDLNGYLKRIARQHADKGLARTFVLLDDSDPQDILGFFTLAVCEIRSEQLPPQFAKKYPPIAPAAKLARLAVPKIAPPLTDAAPLASIRRCLLAFTGCTC